MEGVKKAVACTPPFGGPPFSTENPQDSFSLKLEIGTLQKGIGDLQSVVLACRVTQTSPLHLPHLEAEIVSGVLYGKGGTPPKGGYLGTEGQIRKPPKTRKLPFLGHIEGPIFLQPALIVHVLALCWVKTTTITFFEPVLTSLKFSTLPNVVICVGLFVPLESLKGGHPSKRNSALLSVNQTDDVPQRALTCSVSTVNERQDCQVTHAPPLTPTTILAEIITK